MHIFERVELSGVFLSKESRKKGLEIKGESGRDLYIGVTNLEFLVLDLKGTSVRLGKVETLSLIKKGNN